MPSADLRAWREAVVREHMESENAHDFDTTIATCVSLPHERALRLRR